MLAPARISIGGVNDMPRSKPNHVQVHRIELGTWERERIKNAEMAVAATAFVSTAGIVLVGVGAGLAGYALYQWLKDGGFMEITPDSVAGFTKSYLSLAAQIVPNPSWFGGGDYSAWF